MLFARHDDPNFAPDKVLSYAGAGSWSWVLFAGWLNVTIASWFTNIADAADYARYTRSRTDMWVGTLAAGALGALLATALGAYGAAATLGKVQNPLVLTADVETSWLMLLVVIVFLCVDDWTINENAAQPLFGRLVAFQHVRTDRAVLDRADRERVGDRAIRGA